MQAKLIPVGGGSAVPIISDVTVVGRKRGLCDLVVERGSVSKLHCLIVKTDGLLFIRDLGSTNGTKVNGQRVTRGALLPGDELAFASVKYRVHMGPGEPDPQPGYDDQTEMLSRSRQGRRRNHEHEHVDAFGRHPAEEHDAMDGSEDGEFVHALGPDALAEERPVQLRSVDEHLESLPDDQLESLPEEDFAPGDSESDVRLLSDDSNG